MRLPWLEGWGKKRLSLAESNIVILFFLFTACLTLWILPFFFSGEEGHIHIHNAIFDKMDKEREENDIFIIIPNATEDSVCRNRKCV